MTKAAAPCRSAFMNGHVSGLHAMKSSQLSEDLQGHGMAQGDLKEKFQLTTVRE